MDWEDPWRGCVNRKKCGVQYVFVAGKDERVLEWYCYTFQWLFGMVYGVDWENGEWMIVKGRVSFILRIYIIWVTWSRGYWVWIDSQDLCLFRSRMCRMTWEETRWVYLFHLNFEFG